MRKFGEGASVIARCWWSLAVFRPQLVYYVPSGPRSIGLIKDVVTLLCLRLFRARIVLHFHAGGLGDAWNARFSSQWYAGLVRRAFFGVHGAIVVSERNQAEAEVLCPRRIFTIPNGIPDVQNDDAHGGRMAPEGRPASVLFVGLVGEPKGAFDLADAARLLWDRGYDFVLQFMGEVEDGVRQELLERVDGYVDRTEFLGVLSGEEKFRVFATAAILAFPSHFEAETFGLVCAEAMMLGIPVVCTDWRGLPDVVEHGTTGLVVPINDPQALTKALGELLDDSDLRERFGKVGRARYVDLFGIDRWRSAMVNAFDELCP